MWPNIGPPKPATEEGPYHHMCLSCCGVGALRDYVPRVCGGGGGCAGGGVPLEAVLALSWWGKVSIGDIHIIIVFVVSPSGGCSGPWSGLRVRLLVYTYIQIYVYMSG